MKTIKDLRAKKPERKLPPAAARHKAKYDAKYGELKKKPYEEAAENPQANLTKKQRQALASPAARAKPKDKVTLAVPPWAKKRSAEAEGVRQPKHMDPKPTSIKSITTTKRNPTKVKPKPAANNRPGYVAGDEYIGSVKEDEESFTPHMMYDPKTGEGKMAKVEKDHLAMKEKGWVHDKPNVKEDKEANIDRIKDVIARHQADHDHHQQRSKEAPSSGLAGAHAKSQESHAKAMKIARDKLNKLQQSEAAPTTKQVKMGIGIARDKRYAGGNMTGASKVMNKIKKGLDNHPAVSKELRKQNESTINEQTSYRVQIEGLPAMFMYSAGPGKLKGELRKIVKQPSMIKSVERVTDAVVKRSFRLKAQGRDDDGDGDIDTRQEEGTMGNAPEWGTPLSTIRARKVTPGQ